MASSRTETDVLVIPFSQGLQHLQAWLQLSHKNRQLPPLSQLSLTDIWWQPTKRSQDGLSAIFGRSSADGAKRLRCGGFNHATT